MNTVRLRALAYKTLPALLLASLLLIIDITLNKPDTSAATSDMLPQLPPANSLSGSRSDNETILALYSQFDVPAVTAEPEPITQVASGKLSQGQQALQQGLLRVLYIDDKIYRLTAIVNQRQVVANLTVSDINAPDAPAQRLALQKGDTLQQYKVVSVTAQRITFRHQQRELWLQLFTPEPVEREMASSP